MLLERALDDALGDVGLQLSEYEIISMLSEARTAGCGCPSSPPCVVQSRSRLTHTAGGSRTAAGRRASTCADDERGVELVADAGGLAAVGGVARVHVQSVRATCVDSMTPTQFTAIGDAMAHRA